MGTSDAIMLPHVLRFNADAAQPGLRKIGLALGVGDDSVGALVQALQALFASLRLPTRLRDVGVPHQSLAELATISFDDWYLQSNPRPIRDVAQLQQVLEKAW
jgi:alcohol dehydrogenase class IV